MRELKGWNLQFSQDLVTVNARWLEAEKIYQGPSQVSHFVIAMAYKWFFTEKRLLSSDGQTT